MAKLRKHRVEGGLFAIFLAAALGGIALVAQPGNGLWAVVGWLLVGIGLFALVGAVLLWEPVAAKIPYALVKKDSLAVEQFSEKELGRRCLDLAAKIEDRLGDSRRADPRTLNWGNPDWHKEENRAKEARLEGEHRAKLEGWFVEKAQGEAAFLMSELRSRGLAEENWRLEFFPQSFSVYDLDELAVFFATVGRRLRGDQVPRR